MNRRFLNLIPPLALGLMAVGCNKTTDQAAAKAPPKDNRPEVIVVKPVKNQYVDFEEFIGQTEAVYSIGVTARVTGYLDKVAFNDGDEVKKGDLLFVIDQRPYKAQLDQMNATWAQGEAHLKRLDLDHRRAQALIAKSALSREEFDKIEGDFSEAVALVGIAKAQLETAQLNMEWTEVRSPIDGRLSRRLVDPGNLVRADDTSLTTIVSLDPMYAYFDVDERTLLRLRRLIREGKVTSRSEGEVPVQIGLADEVNTFPHPGRINFSDNRIDAGTGTLRLRAVLDNPKETNNRPRVFSPGMFVRVHLPVGSPQTALFVPEEAIRTDQGNKSVSVITKGKVKDKDGKEVEKDVMAAVKVKVGPLENGLRVVESGLKEDDKVVIRGLQIRPGVDFKWKFADAPKADPVADGSKPDATAAAEGPKPTLAVGMPPTPAPGPAPKPPGQ